MIPSKLRAARDLLGLTQEQLADMADRYLETNRIHSTSSPAAIDKTVAEEPDRTVGGATSICAVHEAWRRGDPE